MSSLKNLVIGTSLAEAGDGVVRTAAAIARATGASPWLVHVFPPPPVTPEIGPLDGDWIERQNRDLYEALAQQAGRTGLASVPGFRPDRLLTRMGGAPWELVAEARRVQADLLVLGAAESGLLHRIFLGSTANGVIRQAPCPVLVLRSEAAFPPARVEIPVDLSPVSAAAYRQGLALLGELGVPLAEAEVLFVLNPFEMGGSFHFTPEQIRRFAGEELRRFMQANSPGPLPRLARVRTGYPREQILAVLAERKADLAILGTHGRSGIERLMIGSVTAEVMHQAPCNLLLIPPGAARARELALGEETVKSEDLTFAAGEPALAGA